MITEKKIMLLLLLIFFIPLSSMQKTSCRIFLPHDILAHIATLQPHRYPWENFTFFTQLGRVNKSWYAATSSDLQNKYIQQLQISPMHLAAMRNDENNIIKLKLHNHSILKPDAQGFTPAHYAVACQQHSALEILKIGGCFDPKIDKKYVINLIKFCKKDDIRSLQILTTSHKEQSNQKYYTKNDLINTIAQNDYLTVRAILFSNSKLSLSLPPDVIQKNINEQIKEIVPYSQGCILEKNLFINITHGSLYCDALCIEHRITCCKNFLTTDHKGHTFLHRIASKNRLIHMLTPILILACKQDPSYLDYKTTNGNHTALHIACMHGTIDCIKKIIKFKKINAYPQTADDNLAVLYAASFNHTNCVTYLLKAGLTSYCKNKKSMTPLHYAALHGNFECMTILLDTNQYECIDPKNNNNRTPLSYAVAHGKTRCVALLLAKGANPNIATQKYYRTTSGQNHGYFAPLHYAAYAGNYKIVKLLLQCSNIDTECKTYKGKTPYDLAQKRKFIKITKLLKKYNYLKKIKLSI